MITQIHHIGITVEDLERSIDFYKSIGFAEGKHIEKDDPKLKAVFLEKNGMRMELFQFEDPNDPKAKVLSKHTGLVSDDLENDLKLFEESGLSVIRIPITKGLTVKNFSFIEDKLGNVFELLEL